MPPSLAVVPILILELNLVGDVKLLTEPLGIESDKVGGGYPNPRQVTFTVFPIFTVLEPKVRRTFGITNQTKIT